MNEAVDPLHEVPVSYGNLLFSKVKPPASLANPALLTVTRGIEIALLLQSTQTLNPSSR